jgi:hypothetical protein
LGPIRVNGLDDDGSLSDQTGSGGTGRHRVGLGRGDGRNVHGRLGGDRIRPDQGGWIPRCFFGKKGAGKTGKRHVLWSRGADESVLRGFFR